MTQMISLGDLPRVMDKLERTTAKHADLMNRVEREVTRIGEVVKEDYDAKLADVIAQYTEQLEALEFRISGYEEENRRAASVLQRRVRWRLAPVRGNLRGDWENGTMQALLALADKRDTYEVEVM